MLENPEILKIGIGLPGDDQSRMKLQWNIEPKGLVDIRNVVKLQAEDNKNGAKHLAKEILGIDLKFKDHKDWKFHEKWESENLDESLQLTIEQVSMRFYANLLFIILVKKLGSFSFYVNLR
jgi:hypothetical protein